MKLADFYEKGILPHFVNWLIQMSKSGYDNLRHTATIVAYNLVTKLGLVHTNLCSQLAISLKQLKHTDDSKSTFDLILILTFFFSGSFAISIH